MKVGKLSIILIFLILLVSLAYSVLAITAKIANPRMVLRLLPGETIEKSIKVINSNNATVNINMSVSGELAGNVELADNYFTLSPGEEKDAYFTITAAKLETTETKIDVMFRSEDEKSAIGLSAVIIVVVSNSSNGNSQNTIDNSNNRTQIPKTNTTITNGTIANGTISPDKSQSMGLSTGAMVLLILTLVLLIILISFLVYSFGKKTKKEMQTKPKRSISRHE